MKYYLIVGEASGDLHASRLMQALRERDGDAEFRFYGGDLMQQAGGTLVCHYRHLAYMGFIPVLLHARTILRGMADCKRDILSWQPDVLILVDYPGFNLKIARFVKEHSSIPVFYYIAPKIWAWKEYRIRHIRRYVDHLFSILPFEVDFFEGKHHYPIDYVGNPTVDEVSEYLRLHPADREAFVRDNGLSGKPVVALLAGSRRQEITDNLRRMVEAARPFADRYELVLAAAPGIDDAFYRSCMEGLRVAVVRNQTYRLLQHCTAALVTSGTATLETALLGVPQVVCYYMKAGWLASLGRRLLIKIPFISLVNLVAGKEVVPELVADGMTVARVRRCLADILPGTPGRERQLEGYRLMACRLGKPGAPQQAACRMLDYLKTQKPK